MWLGLPREGEAGVLTRCSFARTILTMNDLETDLFALRYGDRAILEAYLAAEQRLAIQPTRPSSADPDDEEGETTRWVERLQRVEGVPGDRLAPAHGRLIAQGYLQFQLQGRDAGVVYRLTPAGRAVLASSGDETRVPLAVRQSA